MRSIRLAWPVLLLFLLPAALGAQRPLTPPFLVNAPNGQSSYFPEVAADASGDFVVTWFQNTTALGLSNLYVSRFSAAGARLTGDLLVGTVPLFQKAVAVKEDGSFFIAFVTSSGVMVRLYGPDGALVWERLAAEHGEHPALAVREDGTFLVVWDRFGTIFARVFGGDGIPLGPEREIASADLMASPQVAAGADRGFVVAWGRVRPIPTNPHFNNFTIFAQRLGPAGAPRGKVITVRAEAPNGASSPDVAEDAAGNFLVAWLERVDAGTWGILGRRYTATGTPASGLLILEPTEGTPPRLTMDPAGNFVLAWLEYAFPGKIVARRFTAGGAPFRPAFQVDAPPPAVTWAPDVAGASNGNFVVVWAAGDGIYARLYRKR
jgi:hypothetical protein